MSCWRLQRVQTFRALGRGLAYTLSETCRRSASLVRSRSAPDTNNPRHVVSSVQTMQQRCAQTSVTAPHVSSPLSTGGAGTFFERDAIAHWLAQLLVRSIPPILIDTHVIEVSVQTEHLGWHTDDFLVTCQGAGDVRQKLIGIVLTGLRIIFSWLSYIFMGVSWDATHCHFPLGILTHVSVHCR